MAEFRVAENLRYLREINEYRQEDVSSRINVARQTYSTYENGKRTPAAETLSSLADLYGISIDSLLKADLSKPVINEVSSYGHEASAPGGSRVRLTGAETKMLMDYKSLPQQTQTEIREFVRFKKYLDKKKNEG